MQLLATWITSFDIMVLVSHRCICIVITAVGRIKTATCFGICFGGAA